MVSYERKKSVPELLTYIIPLHLIISFFGDIPLKDTLKAQRMFTGILLAA